VVSGEEGGKVEALPPASALILHSVVRSGVVEIEKWWEVEGELAGYLLWRKILRWWRDRWEEEGAKEKEGGRGMVGVTAKRWDGALSCWVS